MAATSDERPSDVDPTAAEFGHRAKTTGLERPCRRRFGSTVSTRLRRMGISALI